jgi:glutaminyl-peptide cyclotransferase
MSLNHWLLENVVVRAGQRSRLQSYVPEVLRTVPHEVVYIQGLAYHAGFIYESSRLSGVSSLHRLEPDTGAALGRVILPNRYLAGGQAAVVEDALVLLTWQGKAFCYDMASLKRKSIFAFAGEGWGVCYDGKALYISDGTDTLTLYNPGTFERLGEIRVSLEGQGVSPLAELECVGDTIYANLANTGLIVQLDKTTGRVEAVINVEGNVPIAKAHMLSSIAYAKNSDVFYLTGKLWPQVLEVRFATLP